MPKPLIRIKNFIRKITHAGVGSGLSFHKRRKIVLLNTMCMLGLVVYWAFLAINLIKSTHLSFLATNLLAQTVFLTTLFLNHKKQYRAAALFCSIIFLLYFNSLAVLYGKESGLEYLNLLLCASPLVFFDDKKTIVTLSLASLIGFFGCKYSYTVLMPTVQHGNLSVLFHINMAGLFICVFLMFLFFKQEIMNYASLVEKQRIEIAEKMQITAMLEGQEAERKRIATDLHDRLGSMLATVKLYFNSVEENIALHKNENREQYEKANLLLDEACDEVRKISHDLASNILVKEGLLAALEELKETVSKSNRIKMNLLAFGLNSRLNAQKEIILFRIVQELTGNALKHSGAKNLTVQLNRVDTNLNLIVEDDGKGFDPEIALKKNGMGLKNLHERVHKLNGKVNIDSQEGKGSTIIIDLSI